MRRQPGCRPSRPAALREAILAGGCGPDAPPRRAMQQERGAEHHGRAPAHGSGDPQPDGAPHQPEVFGAGAGMKDLTPRKGPGPSRRRRPQQARRVASAVLLVLHHEFVDAGIEPEHPDLGVHVGRGPAPNHELAVEPDVETVVAGAVQFDLPRFGHVPEAAPADAEEAPRQFGIVGQEVEIDAAADVVDERSAGEADVRVHRAVQTDELRRTCLGREQDRGQGDDRCRVAACEYRRLAPREADAAHAQGDVGRSTRAAGAAIAPGALGSGSNHGGADQHRNRRGAGPNTRRSELAAGPVTRRGASPPRPATRAPRRGGRRRSSPARR